VLSFDSDVHNNNMRKQIDTEYFFVIHMYDRLAFDPVNLPLNLDDLEIDQLYLRTKNIYIPVYTCVPV
jgi:hypothetical protein